jgi:hypothetical protein
LWNQQNCKNKWILWLQIMHRSRSLLWLHRWGGEALARG